MKSSPKSPKGDEPTLHVISADPDDDDPADVRAALLWAGVRPWVISALENVKLQKAEVNGSKDARDIRQLLAQAINTLPSLPGFEMSLGFPAGDLVQGELRINTDHPAYQAAYDKRDAFASKEAQLLVERAWNYVAVMPAHGFDLRRPRIR